MSSCVVRGLDVRPHQAGGCAVRHKAGFVIGIFVVFALVTAACAGDSADSAVASTTGASAVENNPDTSVDTDPSQVLSDETDILGNPAGQGFVELNGVRHDFIFTGACQNIFGAIQVAGPLADGSGGNVHAIIPPENWESEEQAQYEWDPPFVLVELDPPADDRWKAEVGNERFVGSELVELTPQQSAVTSFTNDGSRVTGAANFVNEYTYDELETATGTFEFHCP
jgi:hypothetical protein